MVNRQTGRPAGPAVPIYSSDWPYRSVMHPQVLLRCMDLWKLRALCGKGALFFSKASYFNDGLEGMPSGPEVHGTSRSDIAFRKAYPLREDYDRVIEQQNVAKQNTFVSCWAMRGIETSRMWNEYPENGSPDSVILVTSVKAMIQNTPSGMLCSKVNYVKDDFPKTMVGQLSWFLYKSEEKYSWEREYRLLFSTVTELDRRYVEVTDRGYWVDADLKSLVRGVILHPRISSESQKEVATLAKWNFPKAQVRRSKVRLG